MAASEHPAGALRAAVSVHAPRPGFWQRLVEPAASIEEVGARRLARLLSSLLLLLSVLGIAATITGLWVRPEGAVWGGISIVFLGIAYGLSRTRHYPRAALLAVGTLALGALASTYSTVLVAESGGTLAVASWTLLAVILASLYFSVRALLALLLGLLMGLLLLFLAVPAVTAGAFVETAWFLLMTSALIILVTYHQRGVEQDRLAVSERHREELVRLNRSMETMLYVISHDLKEPLRAIQSFSTIVGSRYASKLDDKGQDYLQRVSRT
jgi:signal transduction histidine kinase